MATILYARVSTVEQKVEHQEAQARAAGFAIDDVVPIRACRAFTSALSGGPKGGACSTSYGPVTDVLVVRWVDRPGRNYEDVCDTIRAFMRRGVIVRTVINDMTFDGATKDPVQQAVRDALIGSMAASTPRPIPSKPILAAS
jgi:putative DNA-invertase from lambdoid prophage Rac